MGLAILKIAYYGHQCHKMSHHDGLRFNCFLGRPAVAVGSFPTPVVLILHSSFLLVGKLKFIQWEYLFSSLPLLTQSTHLVWIFPLRRTPPTYCLVPGSAASTITIGLFSGLWTTERIIQHVFQRMSMRKRTTPSKYCYCLLSRRVINDLGHPASVVSAVRPSRPLSR